MNKLIQELQNQIINLENNIADINAQLGFIDYDIKTNKIINTIRDLSTKINEIQYKLQQLDLFNVKVNQAYVNHEIANINIVQDIDKLKSADQDLQDSIKQIHDINTTNTDTEFALEQLEKKVDELSNDQELIFQALLNMQQTFDVFNSMLTKERIMNTAIITVLTVELLSTGILNGNNYMQNLRNVIEQILEAYKAAGCNIDFSQELASLEHNNANGAIAIHVPQMVSISESPKTQGKKKDENIINFDDILNNKHSKQSLNISKDKKSELYTTFQDKLNEVLATKKKKKSKSTDDNNTDKNKK